MVRHLPLPGCKETNQQEWAAGRFVGFNEFVFMADIPAERRVPREQDSVQVLSEGKHGPADKQCGGDANDNNGYDTINNKCPFSAHQRAHRSTHRVKLQGLELEMQNEP